MEQPKTLMAQLTRMFEKITAKTITREEGTLLLNDLVKQAKDKYEVGRVVVDLCRKPPPGLYLKTIMHTVSLARNPFFSRALEWGLVHEDEEVSIASAEGLANLKTHDTKEILINHLHHDSYHVRMACANALIRVFGQEGIEIVRRHGLSHPETYYRLTSALALAKAGRKGVEALLKVLGTPDIKAVQSAADAIINAVDKIRKEDMPTLASALEASVKQKHPLAVMAILRVFSAVGEKAEGFEDYVADLLNYSYEPIQNAAKEALDRIGSEKATKLISELALRRSVSYPRSNRG